MSDRSIDMFVDICNRYGLAEGFKRIIQSNCIRDRLLYIKFHTLYMQLNTKRGKHENFNEELDNLLSMINCQMLCGKLFRKYEK